MYRENDNPTSYLPQEVFLRIARTTLYKQGHKARGGESFLVCAFLQNVWIRPCK